MAVGSSRILGVIGDVDRGGVALMAAGPKMWCEVWLEQCEMEV